ncbi:MAG: SusC/RagA family TonB-linked outer membrane protein [Bacteroidota bacterium]|nr:SusC/RagA family TonB-linked outer membrane protein [Bacteroidota bacterium]
MQLSKILTGLLVLGVCVTAEAQKDSSITITTKQNPAGFNVSGVIKDAATGKALRGIRVTYKDYSAAITDSMGAFTLDVPSPDVYVLLEGEGYQSKQIALKGNNHVTAGLYEDTYTSFYDLANLPMGTVMKNQDPFAAVSVQTDGNWGKVTETPSSYLQGRVVGLNAIRRSGTPNIGATLFLRGINSLYATNQPLIIVDGIIFDNADYGGLIAGHYTDPLSSIDPRDIDNITVIKDGSSTYGTKGANGVIIITTARARELGTKIDFAVYGGINFKPAELPLLDAAGYRVYLSEILQSQGLTDAQIQAQPYMNDDKANADYFRYHNNTDWQNLVFHNSHTKNIYLKVTGGDNIAKYALSLGFMNNEASVKSTDLTRYNMRFNGDLNLSKRLTATTDLSFTFNEQNLRDQGTASKTNPIFLALVKSPLLRFKEVSSSGIESPTLAGRDTFNVSNPLVLTDNASGHSRSYRFLGSIGFNYQVVKSLAVATTVGVIYDKTRENFFIPGKGVTTDTLSTDIATSRSGSMVKTFFSLYNDTRLTYSRRFRNIHDLSASVGFRYLKGKAEQDFGLGFNSPIDQLISVQFGSNALRQIGGSIGESSWLNTYLNADYSCFDKYFVSFNMAMDGSSRFGTNIPDALSIGPDKYAILPSLAAAWLISSEKFVKNKHLDILKLRASYGLSGNDDIGNYTARQTYISQNFLGLQGLVRAGFGNDQLQWEEVRKLNVGLDISVLNERLNLTFDTYRDKTDKMLVYESVPVASGSSFTITNSGAMTTKGIEASVNGRIINKAIKWDMGFNIARSISRVDRLPVDRVITSFAGATFITQASGAPNLFYGYKTSGVFISDNVAAQENLSLRKPDGTLTPFKGGDIRFVDVNGDHVIDENDRQVIGNPNPDFFGAITSKLGYKRFSLDMLFTFSQGNDIYNYTRNQLEAESGYYNQTTAVINRWRTNGDATNIPKATWGDPMGNSRFSDRWIDDGSYLRLRTMTLSYNLPFKQGSFKYAVIYVTGNNLFTLTKYKGFDPEFSASESIFGQGIDNTLEPQVRSVQLGLRIGL